MPTRLTNRTERGEQIALVAKCRLYANRYPELGLLHHIPNGGQKETVRTRRGLACPEGSVLTRMGVLPGIPDLCLPVQADGYAALYIEMKTPQGRVSPAQREMHERLRKAGNHVVVCRSVEEGWRLICIHLGIEEV